MTPAEMVRCVACGGRGTMKVSEWGKVVEICEDCNGEGWVIVRKEDEEKEGR